ncbi:MAG: hypothetical protein QM731_27815 [Chitinophagaceae bacterium]
MKRIPFDPRKIVFLGTYRKMLVFYFWHGRYCVRTVSSLSGKRVKRAAEFKKTMQFAAKLGRASSVASKVYRQLPDGWKLHSLYRKLVGVGNQLLIKQDATDSEIENVLWQYLYGLGYRKDIVYEVIQPSVRQYVEPACETISRPVVKIATPVAIPCIVTIAKPPVVVRRWNRRNVVGYDSG